MSPFKALYGRDPPTIIRYIPGTAKLSALDHDLSNRDIILRQLKHNLLTAQNRQKNQADKHRRDISYAVGDWLFVKLQPYRQLSLRLYRNQKLSQRYFGPFKVLKRIGTVAYKLDLPPSSRIHPVFHVSVLKKCIGNPESQSIPLPLIDPNPSNLANKVHLAEGSNVMDLNPAPMPSTSSNEDPPGKPLGSNRPQREKRTPVVLRGYLVG